MKKLLIYFFLPFLFSSFTLALGGNFHKAKYKQDQKLLDLTELLKLKSTTEEKIKKKFGNIEARDSFNFLSPLFYEYRPIFDYRELKRIENITNFKPKEFYDCTILFSQLSPSLLQYFQATGFNPTGDIENFEMALKELFSYEKNIICPGFSFYFSQFLLNKIKSNSLALDKNIFLKLLELFVKKLSLQSSNEIKSKSDIYRVFHKYYSLAMDKSPLNKILNVHEIINILIYTSEPHELKNLNLPLINKDQSPTYQRLTLAFKLWPTIQGGRFKEENLTKGHRDFEVGIIIGKALRKIRKPISPNEFGKEIKVIIPEIIDDFGYIPERVKTGKNGITYSANACNKKYLEKIKNKYDLQIYSNPALMSTSIFQEMALGFLVDDTGKDHIYKYNNRCFYKFELKYTYDLGDLSLHPEEGEVLLPPFLGFKITSIELDKEMSLPDKNSPQGGFYNQKIIGFIEAQEVDIPSINTASLLNLTNGFSLKVKKEFFEFP